MSVNPELDALCKAAEHVEAALNASGDLWVEAQEIDGLTVARLSVSSKSIGRWMTIEIELDQRAE